MIPAFAAELLRLHPDLVLLTADEEDLAGTIRRGAVFSPPGPDGRAEHRYALWRIFDASLPLLVAVLLNPSTADQIEDDPTVLRMTVRASALGYGGVVIVNLFSWRDVSPAAMKKVDAPIGPACDDVLDLTLERAGLIVCGWGSHGNHRGRSDEVGRRLIERGLDLTCLRITAGGQPEHPLYLPYALEPMPWRPVGQA